MDDKIIEKLVSLNNSGFENSAWDEFSGLPADERKKLLSKLLELAEPAKNANKAVSMPNAASVIKRKLKPGVSFEHWYQEWQAPIKAHTMSTGSLKAYFPVPTRVINLRPADTNNVEEFVTIGFVCSPFESVDELLDARPEELKASESKRKEANDALLVHSENQFYYVASDDIYGI